MMIAVSISIISCMITILLYKYRFSISMINIASSISIIKKQI